MYVKKPPTKELPCLQCGIAVTVSSYARSALCDTHRKERYETKKPPFKELPCKECGVMVWVKKNTRFTLCDAHRKERYPSNRKNKEPETVVEILASEIVDMAPDYSISIEEKFDEYFPNLKIPTIRNFPKLMEVINV